MSDPENPFDALGLDPTLSPAELTERLQRLAERATPEEREKLRARWRALTLQDARRVKLAFMAHPRGPQTGAEPIDALRRRVPPRPHVLKPAPIEATVLDTLLDFGDTTPGTVSAPPQPIDLDPGFPAIQHELSHANPDTTDPDA